MTWLLEAFEGYQSSYLVGGADKQPMGSSRRRADGIARLTSFRMKW